jgi:hypothetical protein
MKTIITIFLFTLATIATEAQTKFPPLDKSPMDMSYYPANYPILKIQDKATEPVVARVIFGRPQKNGRTIFGELVEYGSVWRLGANEATEIEFYKPVKIGNTKIKKGRYTIYCIPTASKWTLILNKDTDTWGSIKYTQSKDVVRVTLPVEKLTESSELFNMMFEKSATGATLIIAWDDAQVSLPILF